MKNYTKLPNIVSLNRDYGNVYNGCSRGTYHFSNFEKYNEAGYFKVNSESFILVPVQSFGVSDQYIMLSGETFMEKLRIYQYEFSKTTQPVSYKDGWIQSYIRKIPSPDTPVDEIGNFMYKSMDYLSLIDDFNFAAFLASLDGLNTCNEELGLETRFEHKESLVSEKYNRYAYDDGSIPEKEWSSKREEWTKESRRVNYFDYILKDVDFTYIFHCDNNKYYVSNGQEPEEFSEVYIYDSIFCIWKRLTKKQYARLKSITNFAIDMIKVDKPVGFEHKYHTGTFTASHIIEIIHLCLYLANRLQIDRILYNPKYQDNFFSPSVIEVTPEVTCAYPGFEIIIERFNNTLDFAVTAEELGIKLPWIKNSIQGIIQFTNFDLFRIINRLIKIHDDKLEYNYRNYGYSIPKNRTTGLFGEPTYIDVEKYLVDKKEEKHGKDKKSKKSADGGVREGRSRKNKRRDEK